MYSIGQFSAILNINKKTLRYYDDIDLFKPVVVDENNKYRYYDEEQLPAIKEIIRLKDVGIPLEQIRKILNEKDSKILLDIYTQRMKEIEKLLKQLNTQKKLIEEHLKIEKNDIDTVGEYSITKGYFIEEGYVYYNKINRDFEEIHSAISDFYANANGLELKQGHIFKRNFDDFSKDVCEIFAYTKENEKKQNIRLQTDLMCLKVVCDGIDKRGKAYKAIFAYADQTGNKIVDVYEKYWMGNGKMNIEIICSID